MAGHQDGVHEGCRGGRAVVDESAEQGRARHLQRRYWEHTIRDDRDYATHMDYIHFNPVKHGYVSDVATWPFSSFHKCVALGLYPSAWAGKDDGAGDRGEWQIDIGRIAVARPVVWWNAQSIPAYARCR